MERVSNSVIERIETDGSSGYSIRFDRRMKMKFWQSVHTIVGAGHMSSHWVRMNLNAMLDQIGSLYASQQSVSVTIPLIFTCYCVPMHGLTCFVIYFSADDN